MGTIGALANTELRDYDVDGVPGSGVNEPSKSGLRALFATIDGAIAVAVAANNIAVVKSTKTALDAYLTPAADTLGYVWNDGTPANNKVYAKVGGTGTGSWASTDIALPISVASTVSTLVSDLAGLADAVDLKAAQTALDALSDAVDDKAGQGEVDALAAKAVSIVTGGTLRDPNIFQLLVLAGIGVVVGMNNGKVRIPITPDATTTQKWGDAVLEYLSETVDPLRYAAPLAAGQQTMIRLQSKLAVANGAGSMAIIGNSWANKLPLVQGIKDRLCAADASGKYPNRAYGWVGLECSTSGGLDGAASTNALFTQLDGLTTRVSANWNGHLARSSTFGWGPDGYWVQSTGTSSNDKVTVTTGASNPTDSFDVYFYSGAGVGTFRTVVDGVTLAHGVGGISIVDTVIATDITRRRVSGLTDAAHTIVFDLSGNSGTVTLYGLNLKRSAGTGLTVHKMGHSGARVYSWGGQIGNDPAGILRDSFSIAIWEDLNPDALALIDTTNDARTGFGIEYFTYGLRGAIDAIRAAIPDIGIILAPSSDSYDDPGHPVVVDPLLFEAEMYRVASQDYPVASDEIGIGFWNLRREIGNYDVAKSLGLYLDETGGGDGNHMSTAGGNTAGALFMMRGFI